MRLLRACAREPTCHLFNAHVQMDEDKEQTLLGAENFGDNLANMRGAENDRIAEAKRADELDEATRDGIIMTGDALKKREQMVSDDSE